MTDYSDPKNRFISWETDADPVDLEAEVNYAVESCINSLQVFGTPEHATFSLCLYDTFGQVEGPFARRISFSDIRAALDELEWDNAEEHAELLASRLEEITAELRKAKGTFGDR